MIGKMLGNRYEIIAMLGAGGMANVYRARCTVLNRIVTVKVLRKELAEDKDFVRRFQMEAQAVALLSHPNIVSIYDVGEEDGVPYLVMEYVEGFNLKEIIRERGPLSATEAVNIGIQVCAALEHAHSKGIIHRDIKSHNILVTQGGRVKVTDFGLARVLSIPSVTMTQSGSVMGSVHYFSPEQARGEEVTPQSDIYSLGVVLYEVVSGRVPFQGDNPISIALKHLQEEPKSLRLENPTIPNVLEKIIFKAMAKDPKNRFSSAEQMQQALAEDQPSGAIYPSEEEQTRLIPQPEEMEAKKKVSKKRKLHPGAIVPLILLGLLLVGGGLFALSRWYFGGTVAVPNVVGLTQEEAEEMLKEEGLEVEVKEASEQGTETDIVVRQDPVARMEVKKGRLIRIWVNKGPGSVWLPDYTGAEEREATLALEGRGFIVKVTRENHDDVPAGYVIRQFPAGDSDQPKGSDVTLVVSKGPVVKEVIVPAVVGLKVDQAEAALGAVELNLGEVTEKPSDKDKGVIIEQSIAPGSSVKKGTAIDVVVSSGLQEKETKLKIDVPEEGELIIVIKDSQGTREVYKQLHKEGDKVDKVFTVYPPGEFQIYFQGKLRQTVPIN
ncbi:MAG TPA: Stk1 family PASTA domain-containing Ser/Thr kinase [Peptococcaceae bacterium]|nr:Stk1 family PASTA domain-containing Ser/Thr kinase [Peptococcaceae bacterium]